MTPEKTAKALARYAFAPFQAGNKIHVNPDGDWVLYDDHLAAIKSARAEGRREALEEAASVCESYRSRTIQDEYSSRNERRHARCIADAIRALLAADQTQGVNG